MKRPLEGITVLEYSKDKSISYTGLRLSDLGARVIRIENKNLRRDGRSNTKGGSRGDSLTHHTLNRGKGSLLLNLTEKSERDYLNNLIRGSHVFMHNFSSDEIDCLGLDYNHLNGLNPSIIYASISFCNNDYLSGKIVSSEILMQAITGLAYVNGNMDDNPTPVGINVGEYLSGQVMVQFILSSLIRYKKTGIGALLELSIFDTLIDLQFEFLTTFFKSKRQPLRSKFNNAHALLSAPYGIYQTKDGYIAIAMMPLSQINKILKSKSITLFKEEESFSKRDIIKREIANSLFQHTNEFWLNKARKLDLWMMPVFSWEQLKTKPGYEILNMEQTIILPDKTRMLTTRCPIKINKEILYGANVSVQS